MPEAVLKIKSTVISQTDQLRSINKWLSTLPQMAREKKNSDCGLHLDWLRTRNQPIRFEN